MAYADYAFYESVYGGTLLDSAEFQRLSARGEEYLEALTFGRCGDDLPEPHQRAAAMAFCAILEEIRRTEGTGGLKEEQVGEWSRTYRESPEKRIAEAARVYLHGTGLLWRGWSWNGQEG